MICCGAGFWASAAFTGQWPVAPRIARPAPPRSASRLETLLGRGCTTATHQAEADERRDRALGEGQVFLAGKAGDVFDGLVRHVGLRWLRSERSKRGWRSDPAGLLHGVALGAILFPRPVIELLLWQFS